MEGNDPHLSRDGLSRSGDLDAAQVEVQRALELLTMYPPNRVTALAIAARVQRIRETPRPRSASPESHDLSAKSARSKKARRWCA